jgi:phage head maturation protease
MSDDYEAAASRRAFEDARRGYSISSGGDWLEREVASTRYFPKPSSKVLEGFACLWDVVQYKGRKESFAKNCFQGSLDSVFFGIDHQYHKKKLGDTDDGSLELIDSDIGLAFRLKLSPGDLERLDGRDEVSPSYIENDVEIRNGVRIIKSATLFDISAVHVASMRTTHAVVRDANKVRPLADEVKNGFAYESAATAFTRALRRLTD